MRELLGLWRIFSPQTQREFVFALIGSVVVGLAEVFGVLAVSPLMLLIIGTDMETGALGLLTRFVGIHDRGQLAVALALFVFFCFVSKAFLGVAFRWWMSGMIARQEVATSSEILRYYIRMPYINHVERGSLDLMRHMNDSVGQFYGSVVLGWLSAATEAISMSMIIVGLLVAAPVPTLLLLAFFGSTGLAFRRIIKDRLTDLGERILELSLANYRATFEVMQGMKEIKLRHNSERFVRNYRQTRIAIARVGRIGSLLSELPKHVFEVLFITGIGIATIVTFAIDANGAGLGTLAVVIAAGYRLLPSTVRLMASLNSVKVGSPSIAMVTKEIDAARAWEAAHPLKPNLDGRTARLPFAEEVQVEDVHYRYPTGMADVLRGVDLTIPKGSSVAFVGGSGAGKTTMVDVLLGLHEPSSGRILVDGVDVAEHMEEWQTSLAMVPQEVYLTDGSLRDNVAFGVDADAIDDDLVARSIRLAQLDSLVAELPEGVHNLVGERGGRLSGGQRQRIGIARALYNQPDLLVLDEATSALDNETERRISETIASLHGDITVVIVAHRLSTVRHCDRIVFFKDGRVEASGTFDEVQKLSPDFARLVQLGSLEPSASMDDLA